MSQLLANNNRHGENFDPVLDTELTQLLHIIHNDQYRPAHWDSSPEYEEKYKATLTAGLKALLGLVSIQSHPGWADAMTYGRDVIARPKDNRERATSYWARSVSKVHRELTERFGPSTIEAAHRGCASLSARNGGNGQAIPHVNKRDSYVRYRHCCPTGSGYYPAESVLAACCYDISAASCSLILSAWLPRDRAVYMAQLTHVAICDDYGGFTEADREARLRMIALAAGVAYQDGGEVVNLFVDGTALQALGQGLDISIESAMYWRAVNGSSSILSANIMGSEDIDDCLAGPAAVMAAHDIFDWRSDAAANSFENGITAVYGMGIEDPFHAFLEVLAKMSVRHPRSSTYAISGMVYMHFTTARYAAWEYRGKHRQGCEDCIKKFRAAAAGAGLNWAPKSPPKSFEEGTQARKLGKRWVDGFEEPTLVQEGISWFHHLLLSGSIFLFDVLAEGVDPIDKGTEWV